MRGRPKVVYSDNGTNFVGMANLLRKIEWQRIEDKYQWAGIKWIFNPPTAAWWGGWWERLVRSVKDLLKRMLGQSRLSFEQLRTHLSHVERTINDRPLTTVTEDPEDLRPLTPAMFISTNLPGQFSEATTTAYVNLKEEYKRRALLRTELQRRFKKDYLAMLVQRGSEKKTETPKEGDVVIIESDIHKRTMWPLGRIMKIFPGRDGEGRVAQVRTQGGVLVRPIQRLYPVETTMTSEEDKAQSKGAEVNPGGDDAQHREAEVHPREEGDAHSAETDDHITRTADQNGEPPRTTRSGRPINKPKRYCD